MWLYYVLPLKWLSEERKTVLSLGLAAFTFLYVLAFLRKACVVFVIKRGEKCNQSPWEGFHETFGGGAHPHSPSAWEAGSSGLVKCQASLSSFCIIPVPAFTASVLCELQREVVNKSVVDPSTQCPFSLCTLVTDAADSIAHGLLKADYLKTY